MKAIASRWLLWALLLAAPQVSASPGFLYVLNDSNTGNQIYAYSVDESTGALTALAGFPLATGGVGDGDIVPQRLAIDPASHRLHALNGGTHSISAYAIAPATGALSPLAFSPIAVTAASLDRLMMALALHPSGSPLVVGNGAGSLTTF